MKLDAWLREEHSLEAKLRVIERLCQAVNSVHDDGEALAALDPSRVEIGPEGRCDLSAATAGSPAPAYTPPDREVSPSASANDIYAAGAIAWEMLAGRPPGASPHHLAEVQPGLDRELVNAVMACLEPAAEWRPRDLTYLAQMAAARQKGKAVPPRGGPRAPLLPRRLTPRPPRRGPRRRSWPLLAALVLVVGLAFVAGRRLLGPGDAQAPPVRPIPPTTPAATPGPLPSPKAPEPAAVEPPVTTTAHEGPPPLAAPPDQESRLLSTREAVPTPTPPLSVPPPPPATEEPVTPPRGDRVPLPTTTTPGPPQSGGSTARGRSPSVEPPARPEAPAPEAPPPTPGPPPDLTALSPHEVKGPGKVLIDLHGRGFRSLHRARVLPVKKVPWGISVVRQKLVSDSLITVLLELSESVEPGEYALALEDGLGTRSEPVTFEVTR